MMLPIAKISHTIYQVTPEKHFSLDKKDGGMEEEESKRMGERKGGKEGKGTKGARKEVSKLSL